MELLCWWSVRSVPCDVMTKVVEEQAAQPSSTVLLAANSRSCESHTCCWKSVCTERARVLLPFEHLLSVCVHVWRGQWQRVHADQWVRVCTFESVWVGEWQHEYEWQQVSEYFFLFFFKQTLRHILLNTAWALKRIHTPMLHQAALNLINHTELLKSL